MSTESKSDKRDAPRDAVSFAAPLLLNAAPQVGNAAGDVVLRGVKRFAAAGTGKPIRLLRGVASDNAALARLGRGTLKAGGRGIAGGNFTLRVVKSVPVALAGGAVVVLLVRKLRRTWVRSEHAAPKGSGVDQT